ncbi:MAG: phage holin family protein [Candidatus Saccharimonadales bacterium]
MKHQFYFFLVRWLINSVAMWVAVTVLATGDFATSTAGTAAYLLAGLLFSVVNALLRPIIIILSLPAILLTLGLFMLVINGILVYVALALVPNIEITFVGAILAGMIISLTNYVLSSIIESYRHKGSYIHADK